MQIFWAFHVNPHPWDSKTPMNKDRRDKSQAKVVIEFFKLFIKEKIKWNYVPNTVASRFEEPPDTQSPRMAFHLKVGRIAN